jgi:hypothetical protein
MRKTLGVCALILLLTGSASAGIMGNDTPAPSPQPTNAVQEPTTNGIMGNDAADDLTQIALDLLAALPSLL